VLAGRYVPIEARKDQMAAPAQRQGFEGLQYAAACPSRRESLAAT
jgi:hypothetical protein